MYIPHIPSLTLEEGIFKGLKPAFVQWYFPSEQADVPEKRYEHNALLMLVPVCGLNKVQYLHIRLWAQDTSMNTIFDFTPVTVPKQVDLHVGFMWVQSEQNRTESCSCTHTQIWSPLLLHMLPTSHHKLVCTATRTVINSNIIIISWSYILTCISKLRKKTAGNFGQVYSFCLKLPLIHIDICNKWANNTSQLWKRLSTRNVHIESIWRV